MRNQELAQLLFEIHLEAEVKQWIPGESYVDLEETQDAINFFSTSEHSSNG